MTTTALFNHIDITTHISSSDKLWTKVDGGGESHGHEQVTRPVYNLRDQPESEFNTDVAGFGTFRWPKSQEIDFDNDAVVRGPYYDDVIALLHHDCDKRASNENAGPGGNTNNKVKKVVIFDHTIRRRLPDAARAPVQRVHVDQTAEAVATRIQRHLPPDEAEELLKHRFQLINVWRPIGHAAVDHPLAVIDWRSTKPEDYFAVDLMYPKRPDSVMDDDDRGKEVAPDREKWASTEGYEVRGETMGVQKNENHKFYYVKDMTPDEVLLLKCYDSWGEGEPAGHKGIAVRTPHTAFADPNTPADAKPRESIEVRALVFYDE